MTLPDLDNLSTFGGQLLDYTPVVDPTTDRPAAGANQAYADVAQMCVMAAKAYVIFDGNTGVVSDHNSLWGGTLGVLPVVTHPATGQFLITWPTIVVDQLGVSHTLSIRFATCELESAGQSFGQKTSANTATAFLFNSAGTATNFAGVKVKVMIW